jgi:hypothetical protein
MFLNGRSETIGSFIERLIPRNTLPCPTTADSLLWIVQTICGIDRLVQGRALGAQATAIGRVFRIAPQSGNRSILGFDKNAATDTAVATGGLKFRSHVFPSGLASATAMPPRKIMDLHEKRGNSILEYPLFSASISARVPI